MSFLVSRRCTAIVVHVPKNKEIINRVNQRSALKRFLVRMVEVKSLNQYRGAAIEAQFAEGFKIN